MTVYLGSAVADQKDSGKAKSRDSGHQQQKEKYLNHGRVSGFNNELLYRSSTIDSLHDPEDDWTPSTFRFSRDGSGKRPKDLSSSLSSKNNEIYKYMDAEDLKTYNKRIQLIPITQTRRGQSLGGYVLSGSGDSVTSLSTSTLTAPESARLEWSLAAQIENRQASSSIGKKKEENKEGANGTNTVSDPGTLFLFGHLRAEADKRGVDSGATLAMATTSSSVIKSNPSTDTGYAPTRPSKPPTKPIRKPLSINNDYEQEESVLPTFKKTKKRRVNMKLAVSAASTNDYYENEDEAGPSLLPKKSNIKHQQKNNSSIVQSRIKPAENAEGSKLVVPQFVKVKHLVHENQSSGSESPQPIVYGCFVRDDDLSSFRDINIWSLSSLQRTYQYVPKYLATEETVPPMVPAGGSFELTSSAIGGCSSSSVKNEKSDGDQSLTIINKMTEEERPEKRRPKRASRWDVKPPVFNCGPGLEDKSATTNTVAKVNADKLSGSQEKNLQSSSLQFQQAEILQHQQHQQPLKVLSVFPPHYNANSQNQQNLMHQSQPRPTVPRISMAGAMAALQNSFNAQSVTTLYDEDTHGAQSNFNKREEKDIYDGKAKEYRYEMFLKHNAGLANYYADPYVDVMLRGWSETQIAAELNAFVQQATGQSSSSSSNTDSKRAIVFTAAASATGAIKEENDRDQAQEIIPEQTTRSVSTWAPDPLLCKRFGVAVPHSDNESFHTSRDTDSGTRYKHAASRNGRKNKYQEEEKEKEERSNGNNSRNRRGQSTAREMLVSQPPANKKGTVGASGTVLIDLYHNARLSVPRAARWLYAAIFNPLNL
ncbi:uncharacterized protein SAPINGB_P004021 [Magnusiomyces paraingens]|uniref:Uncharacterized protein n=1 Tax=Magnusiomyces paraingens TaxID=2606893 RepID=A0A5E8BUJ6_9ASCO|nr:uncharacterized protein SAPINGB_P004021 [Saprochaete ingens]VVT54329.1 unnamed protein product [Saprochaete ingens]